MPIFDVTLLHDLSSSQRIEAETPDAAFEHACQNAPSRLCHHCSTKYEMGDVIRAIVSDEAGDEVMVDDMGGAPSMGWLPIEDANKDEIQLVNDTSGHAGAAWVAAKYISHPEWSGWAYEDDMLTDSNPLGPNPTHYITLPPVPGT